MRGAGWTPSSRLPPKVAVPIRFGATSRSPGLTRSRASSCWSEATQRRRSAWVISGPAATTTASAWWVRTTSTRLSYPLVTGTGQASGAGSKSSDARSGRHTATGSNARRPPGRAASSRSSRTCDEGPTRTVGTAREGATSETSPRTVADPRHTTTARSSAVAATSRGASSVPAPGISVGRLQSAVAVARAAARSARTGNRWGSAASRVYPPATAMATGQPSTIAPRTVPPGLGWIAAAPATITATSASRPTTQRASADDAATPVGPGSRPRRR